MSTAIVVGTQAIFYVPTAQAITFTPGGSGKVFVTIDSGNRPHARTGPILAATAVTIPAGATVYATAVGSNGTYSDVSAGGGGGAAAFTDLTDAPATITPNAFLIGAADGTAVEFLGNQQAVETFSTGPAGAQVIKSLSLGAFASTDYDAPDGTATLSAVSNPTSDSGEAVCELVADSSVGSALFRLTASAAGAVLIAKMEKGPSDIFKMANFEVVASDATATLTVNAVEYEIAKAIPVDIGGDTYFWPLFGPVA